MARTPWCYSPCKYTLGVQRRGGCARITCPLQTLPGSCLITVMFSSRTTGSRRNNPRTTGFLNITAWNHQWAEMFKTPFRSLLRAEGLPSKAFLLIKAREPLAVSGHLVASKQRDKAGSFTHLQSKPRVLVAASAHGFLKRTTPGKQWICHQVSPRGHYACWDWTKPLALLQTGQGWL